MGSFEWMELQTLTNEIAVARSRLTVARSSRNPRHARALEEEITAAEAHRTRLLGHITTNLADTPEPASDPKTTEGAKSSRAMAPVAETLRHEADGEPQTRAPADRNLGNGAASPAAAPTDGAKGGTIVWDQLTPGDIARATNELGVRRAETLARHAEELKGLEADQTQLESLGRAIEAFVRKFNRSTPKGDIATLGEDRGQQLQAHG